jgi:VIT1/CCC1 family predicted Fe2+/Mn2+ transporter
VEIEPILVGFLIVAPFLALGVMGVAIARYSGPNPTVQSVRPAGWPIVAIALVIVGIWLLLFRFLEI